MSSRYRASRRLARARGFTLIELLVATMAGLFVAIAAFALAKQSSSFFQQEARVATAQFSSSLGFERLRADIARAGYMSSPNVRVDPALCGNVNVASWNGGMAGLAAVRIVPSFNASDPFWQSMGVTPDRLELSGSYSTVEQFAVRTISQVSGNYQVFVQKSTAACMRAACNSDAGLAVDFPVNRIVRIVDPTGHHLYGIISTAGSLDSNGSPYFVLTTSPDLVHDDAGNGCGIPLQANGSGACCTGWPINVVNWIRYEVRDLTSSPPTALAPLYDAGAAYAKDTWKRDLVRVELDPTSISGSNVGSSMTEFADTLEVVAENAVDMKFGLTYVTGYGATNVDPIFATEPVGGANIGTIAGAVTSGTKGTALCTTTATTARPNCIRAVRARLGIRSREFDRAVGVSLDGGVPLRVGVPDGGSFARVRTLTADIQLPNLAGVVW